MASASNGSKIPIHTSITFIQCRGHLSTRQPHSSSFKPLIRTSFQNSLNSRVQIRSSLAYVAYFKGFYCKWHQSPHSLLSATVHKSLHDKWRYCLMSLSSKSRGEILVCTYILTSWSFFDCICTYVSSSSIPLYLQQIKVHGKNVLRLVQPLSTSNWHWNLWNLFCLILGSK